MNRSLTISNNIKNLIKRRNKKYFFLNKSSFCQLILGKNKKAAQKEDSLFIGLNWPGNSIYLTGFWAAPDVFSAGVYVTFVISTVISFRRFATASGISF